MARRPRVAKKVPAATRIAQRLAQEIESDAWPIGARMATVRDLADRFETSVRTVHVALGELESKGYVVRRQGSGTYVARTERELTMADTAVLCTEATGHIFGDLTSMLCKGLHAQGMLPITANIAISDPTEKSQVIQRAASGAAPFFIVHANQHFPVDTLLAPPFQNKTILGIVDWCTDALVDRVHRVVVDHAEGGRIVAHHLAEKGHRRALVVGTSTMIEDLAHPCSFSGVQGREFLVAWQELGGKLNTLVANVDPAVEPSVVSDELLSIMTAADAPTAIFGLMDAAAWACQKVLLTTAQDRAASVDIVGYGNTPWSRSAHPPFSSVDWNISAIVQETLDIVTKVRRGDSVSSRHIAIRPSLILR